MTTQTLLWTDGATNIGNDKTCNVKIYVNGIKTNSYYNFAYFWRNTLTATGSIQTEANYNSPSNGFYYAHWLAIDGTRIQGRLSFQYAVSTGTYLPYYEYKCNTLRSGLQYISNGVAFLNQSATKITSLEFELNFSAGTFRKGTNIKVYKSNFQTLFQ